MRKFVGLRRYQYTFALSQYNKMLHYKNRLGQYGAITELFINNAWGFEIRFNKEIK